MSVWGFATATHGTADVGTASGTVTAANAARVYALLQNNNSGTAVYLSLGTAAAVLNTGIRLAAGGDYEMSRDRGNLWTGPIMGIAADGPITILITQGTG